MIMNMNIKDMKKLTLCKQFCDYFEKAKNVYCQERECEKVTQELMVVWYNNKFDATLTAVNLSKYLNGKNNIPLDVYVNMRYLAGFEERWVGASASRKEYEISSYIDESLSFIIDETESMGKIPELENAPGELVIFLYRKTSELCEAVVAHDNSLIKLILNEIQNEIYNKSNIIKQQKNERMHNCAKINKSFFTNSGTDYSGSNNLEDIRILKEYDDVINKFHELERKIGKCILLQSKNDWNHYWKILGLQGRRVK